MTVACNINFDAFESDATPKFPLALLSAIFFQA